MMNRVAQTLRTSGRGVQLLNASRAEAASTNFTAVRQGHAVEESPEEFDQRFIDYLNRPNIDGWEVRKAMTELQKHDLIAEPALVTAALRACRRINDHSLAVRFLESLVIKCGSSKKHKEEVLPWIMQEIKPVTDELGISTIEAMGYDKPEFWIPDANWWWERSWYTEYGYDKKPGYTF